MSAQRRVPDAWDDDYETFADRQPPPPPPPAPKPAHAPFPKISRAERNAQHAEANRQAWNTANNPDSFHYVETRSEVPLKSDFKPQVKVLARKPKKLDPNQVSRVESGVGGLKLAQGPQHEEDSEEEEAKQEQMRTLRKRQEQAKADREEKQKKYAEVRERLFGSSKPTQDDASGASPVGASSGRVRSGKASKRGGKPGNTSGSRSPATTDQSPARPASRGKGGQQLHDAAYAPKPNSTYLQKRESIGKHPELATTSMPIRMPKGPDGKSNGFAPRGGRAAS